jgi:hypothetical protein
MPKLPVDKWGFSIFPKDSPYLDALQEEKSDTEEDIAVRRQMLNFISVQHLFIIRLLVAV